jgi:hypothetical protein
MRVSFRAARVVFAAGAHEERNRAYTVGKESAILASEPATSQVRSVRTSHAVTPPS